jgi:hypothetical protein
MQSAATATGRPLPPSGKSLPENRPAPLSCRATRQLAAPKLHLTDVTSHPQCYIPALTGNDRRSPRKFNRQPRRLEFTVSRTKQTPAPQINRQLSATSPKSQNTLNLLTNFLATSHSSLATASIPPRATSNRHTVRLENAISHRKQTLGTLSNRHFLQLSASHNLRIADANRPPQAANKNVSNRQWQILEINVNLSKKTIAPRSNRQKNAIFTSRLPQGRVAVPRGCARRTRFRAPRKQLVSRAGIFWGLCGSRLSAGAGRRSFRSGCRKAPGR